MEIKKGDWFKCISTKGLTAGFYTKNQYYKSDRDGFITDNDGDTYHKWDNLKSLKGDLIFQKLYTLQDLKDSKCALENDGQVRQLNIIMTHCFSTIGIKGSSKYYWGSGTSWSHGEETDLPTQSVADFLPQIEKYPNTKADFDLKEWKPTLNPIEPTHYGGADNPLEAIKIIQHYNLSFELGNVLKYILRHDKKGMPLEDLKKAQKYLEFEISKYN